MRAARGAFGAAFWLSPLAVLGGMAS